MGIVIRLIRALPLLAVLAVVAVLVYALVSWRHSPNRAKEVLIKLFTVLGLVLTVFFCAATAYAWTENNVPVLELAGAFAAVSAAVLVVTRICRWRFIKNHPNYQFKPSRVRFL